MPLKLLNWQGKDYSFSIRRRMRSFFRYATACHVHRRNMTIPLPDSAGLHILHCHALAMDAVEYFDTKAHWQTFHQRLCDQYADFYVMARINTDNVFSAYGDRGMGAYSVQELANSSEGYIGPRWWPLGA